MKVRNLFFVLLWLLSLTIACNTQETPKTPENAALEEGQLSQTETAPQNNHSLEGEEFPDRPGFKGRHNDYVFFIEMLDNQEVKGFVRHKDQSIENELSGKMSSPFAFEAEELGEDPDGDELVWAKVRGKISDDPNKIELDYNDSQSASSFRLDLKR